MSATKDRRAQDNPVSGIDALIEQAATNHDKRFVLEDLMSMYQIRQKNKAFGAFMTDLHKLSRKGTKGHHPYFAHVYVLAGATFAQAKGEFWMSRRIFNGLLAKAGRKEMSGSAFAAFETWLLSRPTPFIHIEIPQEGSKPAMWVLGKPLRVPLEQALADLLSSLNFEKCKQELNKLKDLSLVSRETKESTATTEPTGGVGREEGSVDSLWKRKRETLPHATPDRSEKTKAAATPKGGAKAKRIPLLEGGANGEAATATTSTPEVPVAVNRAKRAPAATTSKAHPQPQFADGRAHGQTTSIEASPVHPVAAPYVHLSPDQILSSWATETGLVKAKYTDKDFYERRLPELRLLMTKLCAAGYTQRDLPKNFLTRATSFWLHNGSSKQGQDLTIKDWSKALDLLPEGDEV